MLEIKSSSRILYVVDSNEKYYPRYDGSYMSLTIGDKYYKILPRKYEMPEVTLERLLRRF